MIGYVHFLLVSVFQRGQTWEAAHVHSPQNVNCNFLTLNGQFTQKILILSSVTHHHVIPNLLYLYDLTSMKKNTVAFCKRKKEFTFGIVLVSFCNGFDSYSFVFILWRHFYAVKHDCKMVKKKKKRPNAVKWGSKKPVIWLKVCSLYYIWWKTVIDLMGI